MGHRSPRPPVPGPRPTGPPADPMLCYVLGWVQLQAGDEAGADRPRGSTSRERAADDRLNALLAEAQTRLDDLQTQRRAAVARRKRVELAWQAALAEVNRLDAAVDAALLEGEESQARRHLAAQQQGQARAQEWAELLQVCAQVLDELTATAQTQEARLLEARRQRAALETWERTAGAVETLTRAQREWLIANGWDF